MPQIDIAHLVANRYISLTQRKFVFVIACSKKKLDGGGLASQMSDLSFSNILNPCREELLRKYINAGNAPLDWKRCMPAYDRYRGIIYSAEVREKLINNPENVLIVSALFGLIKPHDLIPYYDLSMTKNLEGTRVNKFWRNEIENCHKCILNEALLTIKNQRPDILFVHLLPVDYQDAFCGFLKNSDSNRAHTHGNYIPYIMDPPNYLSYDTRGWWKKNYLSLHLM